MYDNLQKYDLPNPEAIFTLDFFRERPAAFYELAKEMWPGNFSPTTAHYFIKLLHDKGILLRCYSQNIDSLERQAGLPEAKLVAAHGNFDKAHVIKRDSHDDNEEEQEVDVAELKAAIDQGPEALQALRRAKGGLVKPRIVFFGEPLPERFLKQHRQDLAACDLLLVIGTSLVVGPFNSLVGLAAPTAPRLLINREPAGLSEDLTRGFRFHKQQNWRDVFFQGEGDEGCRQLVEKLGWASDLEELVAAGAAAERRAREAAAPPPAAMRKRRRDDAIEPARSLASVLRPWLHQLLAAGGHGWRAAGQMSTDSSCARRYAKRRRTKRFFMELEARVPSMHLA